MTMRKKILAATVALAVLMVFVVAGALAWRHFGRLVWKGRAIASVTAFSGTPGEIDKEAAALKSRRTSAEAHVPSGAWWFSDRLILMESGEWLAYANCVSHEFPLLGDHFIAKGSDAKWYYTSNHFCKGMLCLVLELDGQPRNLELFMKAYHLEEFDGKSDECLKPTQFMPDMDVLRELNER